MGVIRRLLGDGLTNALTGLGTTADTRYRNAYTFCPLSHVEIEAAYRGSGLMRKVIDIPAFDMVREWRDWQAQADEIEKLEAEERRLGLQGKIMLAEILRGLGGGALILGAPGDAALPVNVPALGEKALAYLHVVNRWQLSAQEWVDDPTDELFGGPNFWQMHTTQGQRRIHPSRVVCFKGDPLPHLMSTNPEEQFWGESRVQRVLDAVQNSDAAQQAFSSLIVKARNTIIGIPGLTDLVSTATGEQQLGRRLAALMLGESMYNASLRDAGDGSPGAGETIDHRQVTWDGIPDVMYAFATFVAAVADIPVTRLLGRAAEGMNASGDSQQKDWNKMVGARQNLQLRPCLDALDAVLIPSALGSRPGEVWWKFSPLDTPSEKEEADRFKVTMEAIEKVQNTGAVPGEAFAKGLQGTLVENGWIVGLETALDEVPEDERYGLTSEPDETDPSKLVAANENEAEVAEMQRRGAITSDQAQLLLADARPRTLYVSRRLLNGAEFVRWAKGQGFATIAPADELHVTICFSRKPVDWMKMGSAWEGDSDGKLTVKPGGARLVERLGDKGAVVLMFAASELSWRHEDMKRNGASFDFDEYQPHVTITYEAPADLDLDKVDPYRGKLVFGPEIFAEVVEDWEKGVEEA